MTGEHEHTFESTPTWATAVICTVIVAISLGIDFTLHLVENFIRSKSLDSIYYGALKKIKKELRVLGILSLLMAVFQSSLGKICVSRGVLNHMLPCKEKETTADLHSHHALSSLGIPSRLLASVEDISVCSGNKIPLLSNENLHQIHIFVFVLAVVHIISTLIVVVVASTVIRHLEDSFGKVEYDDYDKRLYENFADKQKKQFLSVLKTNDRLHFVTGRSTGVMGWVQSFFKQFYHSVTESDYIALKHGFFMSHCEKLPRFNFRTYLIRVLECYYYQVVGISWYLWGSVIIFLLINIHGWHARFWISLVPDIILLAIGTNLKHIVTLLAHEVVKRYADIKSYFDIEYYLGMSSDTRYFSDTPNFFNIQSTYDHFRICPRIFLGFIHLSLFQSTLEITYFFWLLALNGFDPCMMAQLPYIVSRAVIGAIILAVCSYSTLPLYLVVAQMGSDFKKDIFVSVVLKTRTEKIYMECIQDEEEEDLLEP